MTKHTLVVQGSTQKMVIDRIVAAYLAREKLSSTIRRMLLGLVRVKIRIRNAVRVVFAFARGDIADPWSRQNLRLLATAWLRLGERFFCFLYRWVRPRHGAPRNRTFHKLMQVANPLREEVV